MFGRINMDSSNLSGLFLDIKMNLVKYVWIHLIRLGSLSLNSHLSSQSFCFRLSRHLVWLFLVNFRSFCQISQLLLPLTTSYHHVTMHHTSQGGCTSPQTSSTSLNSPDISFPSSIIYLLSSSESIIKATTTQPRCSCSKAAKDAQAAPAQSPLPSQGCSPSKQDKRKSHPNLWRTKIVSLILIFFGILDRSTSIHFIGLRKIKMLRVAIYVMMY